MIRFASLLAAATFAVLAAPAWAQDGVSDQVPALPALDETPLDQMPRAAASTRLAYSAEERAAWLVQCDMVYRQAGVCDAYLARYEQAATDPVVYYGVQVVRSRAEADCPDDDAMRPAPNMAPPVDDDLR